MPLDPVSSLMLDEAGALPGRVLVLDAPNRELVQAVADCGADVRAWNDDIREETLIAQENRLPDRERLAGHPPTWSPDLVLWRLPRSLSALEDYAQVLASRLPAHAVVIAGGRVKHMTPSQNAVLARSFTDVSASRGRQKSRVLRAAGPIPAPLRWPQRRYLHEVGLSAVAHGNVFATNRLDDGTHLLLRTLTRLTGEPDADAPPSRRTALDLGCGSGLLASWLAMCGWVTTASDVSRAALASARLTATANNTEVSLLRVDGLDGIAGETYDLIVSNPPFHRGAAKDSSDALAWIAAAGPALKPGGELWLVFNSHLPYLPALRRHIGPTNIEAQDRSFIVTRSLKEPLQ